MTGRTWTAVLIAAALLCSALPASAAVLPAPGGQPCRVSPHYTFTVTAGFGLRMAHLDVRFPNTCGMRTRAYYIHRAAFGPQVQHGRSVHGHAVTSTVVSRDPAYCSFGWERQVGRSWQRMALRSRHGC